MLRRFTVECTANVVTLTPRFGTLTIDSGLTNTTDAPIADPTTAPTLAGSGSGTTFAAGDYHVAYSDVTASGETLLSPFKTVTLTATQQIDVSALTLTGTSRNWYMSPAAGSNKLRYIANTNGSAFSLTTLPTLNAQLPPDMNTTGCEVMKISAVFSDRAETRSGTARSNVQVGTFNWFLGSREDTVNEIQLKYRDASRDWQLVTLKLRDDDSIAKIKATKPKEINGQAIDNTDQAYRIAAGLLAEKRDGDFFYSWSANRQALLLQEGDVVAITDDGSGVYNFPVFIEQIEFSVDGVPSAKFTGRKYTTRLYDDSVVERSVSIVSEAAI